jgi:YYY domain-containing protein
VSILLVVIYTKLFTDYNDAHMPTSDIWLILRWWGTLFLVGAASYPLTKQLFAKWYDHGYLFSKAIGLAFCGWVVLVLGMAHVLPFELPLIYLSLAAIFVVGLSFADKHVERKSRNQWIRRIIVVAAQEAFFLAALWFWSWIKAHEPSIHGLEKFMDYGFMNSLMHTKYFPAMDMWYPPESINYYYFGHLVTAFLTKLSGLDLGYTFNMMLATLFAFTLTMSFSLGFQLLAQSKKRFAWAGAILTSFLVTLAGNLQTIYAFTQGYTGENVKPFWQLWWPKGEFLKNIFIGWETYWYANATRFIPYAIHEFPSYSFVVSDIHVHVLSIPFVLLAIALLLHVFDKPLEQAKGDISIWLTYVFYGFLVGVLLMTNALDGPIYLGLFLLVYALSVWGKKYSWRSLIPVGVVVGASVISSLPFLAHFKSFVNGVALNCPPSFLANSKIGPLLFEGVEKCQRSPFWMLWVLWGFFWFCGIWWMINKFGFIRKIKDISHIWSTKFTHTEKILVAFFFFSVALTIFPEFFYFKDIYPMHFRSNTMFKLGYQAFMLFSLVSGYAVVKLISNVHVRRVWGRRIFIMLLLPQLFLVCLYPYFSIRSYFGALRQYEGVYGLRWLYEARPDDYRSILWLTAYNQEHYTDTDMRPILLEADGDSYTDYARFSVFTGMPNPIGWAVHEWLWRGSYDVVSPRREDVRVMYESTDIPLTQLLLTQYNVRYIIVGSLEREKFADLHEEKFSTIAREISRIGDTVIYERSNSPVDKN